MVRSGDGNRRTQSARSGRMQTRPIKLFALILAVLVGLCSSIAIAYGDDAPSPEPDEVASSAPPSEPEGTELKDERTATSQTFLLPDGSREARIYDTPINYRDAEGDWKPIDESFEELDSGRLTNGPNSFDVSLPERLGADPVRLSIGSAWVTTELLGAEPQAVEPEDATASYDSAGSGGASFEFANLADGLKEEIVIAGPSQPSTFHFDLDASSGLVPTLADDGSIQFRDANDRVVVTLPAPSMSDSADTPAVSRAIHYELGPEVEGHWELAVEADRDWLTQPDRAWPVRLDPTMTVGSPLDCTIGGTKGQAGWIGCSTGGQKVDVIGYLPQIKSSEDAWQRGLLYLDTSVIPSNAPVSSATLNLYSTETALNTSGVEVQKTSKPWTGQASWSQYDGPTHLWTTEGGDYSESLGQILTSQRGSQAGWWQFGLPAKTVEGEAAKAADLGILLKLIDDKSRVCGAESCTPRLATFSSSAADDTTKRPYLSVVYSVAPAAPTVLAKVATLINGTTATLNAGVNPNGVATTYQFEYGTTTAYGKVVPATAKAIGLGKTEVAVSEPLSGLSSGTTYHFRISATNALGKTVSEDKIFTTLKLPTATTEAATEVKAFEATLRGAVNPNGVATTYQFEYGPTTSYGTTVPSTAVSVGSGSSSVAVTRLQTGLTEGSTYHFRIKAINENGTVFGTDKTLATVDVPETTFTSPHPSYTARELSSVTFASDQSGSTFKCALDEGEKPTKVCSSPYAIPSTLKEGWHTLVVAAINSGGVEDPTPAKYTFNPDIYPPSPATSKLTAPTEGEETASYYTLQAEWGNSPAGGGVTGVTFQMKLDQWKEFRNVPGECVKDGKGNPVSSWPLPVTENPGHSSPVFFKATGCPSLKTFAKENIKFRAAFDGGTNAAGASEPVSTDNYTINATGIGAPTDATQQIGPANVDLLTGQYTITRTDVSIPVPGTEATLEFARTYGTGYIGGSKVMGNWQPSAPVEQAYSGEAWSELRERHENAVPAQYDPECEAEGFSHEECMVEEEVPAADWIEMFDSSGATAAFEIKGGSYVAPEYMKEWILTKQGSGAGSTFELVDPQGTHTVFTYNQAVSGTYRPTSVSWQATPKSARMVYELPEGTSVYRLIGMIAPAPAGVTCTDTGAATTPGCRSLSFQYKKGEYPYLDRLESITYCNSSGQPSQAQEVARYEYNSYRQLAAEWDPRVPGELKEAYTYDTAGPKLRTLTPPGQEPVTFDYAMPPESSKWRLKSVSRPSLTSPATAQTTIAYGVPISGSGAPYDMSAATVATWGQADYPVNATAVFPPTQVPGETPSDYSQATVTYMDPDGYVVNTASAQKPGASGPSISTSETDRHGNVLRSLSPQNRLLALAAGGESVARSKQLDTHSLYSPDGTMMWESFGPMHKVRLAGSGATVNARLHTLINYDEGAPTPPAGTPWPHLPTREVTSAWTEKEDAERRVTKTVYDWSLRKPTHVILDPGEAGYLNLDTRIAYDSQTGQATERSLPANPSGGDAHTTKTIYYQNIQGNGPCEHSPQWAGLPCEVKPAAQPGTAGQPDILVTKFKKYSGLDQPEEIIEGPGGSEAEASSRKTTIKYDKAGRVIEKAQIGGGQKVPPTEMTYDPETGLPIETKFNCVVGPCSGGDTQSVKTIYDKLGRPEKYQDADGNTAETKYDLMGRPATISDGKGIQTATYDPTTGVLTSLQDSAAGTFTATYNADGALVERGLPNGLVAKATYDESGAPTHLSYVKTTMCSTNCTWLDFNSEQSIRGEVLAQSSNLSSQVYYYDVAGRLTRTLDTPAGGSCTTRSYSFDKDSNRTALVTRSPGIAGACDTTSAGTSQNYSYDAADRLLGAGLSYDEFGRITSLPAGYAGGGSSLKTEYFSNEMVALQSQGGVTNTFQLDATGRQRQRLQGGGLEGTEIFHYSGGTDSPAWTIRGAVWSRSIAGIGGELAAIQDSGSGTTLQLTNLHGDVVATASLSQSATKPTATFEFDEFGNPEQAGSPRFGWLGGKSRRTELPSGVIQMGVRSYVPTTGRFLAPDPVLGGSANAYDYANADPVNDFDLGGTCALKKCKKLMRVARRAALRALSRIQARRGSGGGGARAIIESIFSPTASLSFQDCVPGEDVGLKASVWNKVMGSKCVPKLHLGPVNSAAETQADAVAGVGWCIAINTFPITSVNTGVFAPLEAAAYCSSGPQDRPWAYVHADGDGVPANKSTW